MDQSRVAVQVRVPEQSFLLGSSIRGEYEYAQGALIAELEATLYGRDIIDKSTETSHITVDVFEPDLVPRIPSTWWDHLKHDLAYWLARHGLKERRWWHWRAALTTLGGWLQDRVVVVRAPQAYSRRSIPTATHHRRVTLVCPHVGNHVDLGRHTQFLVYADPGPACSFAVPDEGVIATPGLRNETRAVREHAFRHALAALVDQAARPFPHSCDIMPIVMRLKDIFDRYGVGP